MSSNQIAASDLAGLNEIIAGNDRVVVKFGAQWCAPCKQIQPTLDTQAAAHPDVTVVLVDVDLDPTFASTFKIRSVPVLVQFNGGVEQQRLIGAQKPDAIAALFDMDDQF